jgi:hypothetical protein
MNIYLLKENIDFKEIINERMKKREKEELELASEKSFLT